MLDFLNCETGYGWQLQSFLRLVAPRVLMKIRSLCKKNTLVPGFTELTAFLDLTTSFSF